MDVVTSLDKIEKSYLPSVIALGTFDGLHLGHRDVIKTAQDYALEHKLKLIIFTFRDRKSVV